MARKKRSNKSLSVVIVVLFFFIIACAAFYLFLNNPFQQSVLPIDSSCYVKSSGTTQNSFRCQSPKCDAVVLSQCSGNPTGSDPIVIARASGVDLSWLAIYDSTSKSLQSYCKGSVITGSLTNVEKNINLPYGYTGIVANGPFNPCRSSKCVFIKSGDRYQTYSVGSCGADLTPTPKYTCQNQEVCDGTFKSWQCNQDVLLNSNIYTTLQYSDSKPGNYSSSTIHLSNSDVLTASGSDIKWVVIDDTKACTASQCTTSGDGYKECIKSTCPELSSTVTACLKGEKCTQSGPGGSAVCSTPFTTTGKFTNDRGDVAKTGYGMGESIYFQYNIDSATIVNANLDFVLVDLNGNELTPKQTKVVSSFPQTYKITFPAQTTTGTYKVRVDIRYSDILTPEYYTFSIANPITVVIHAAGETGEGSLFTNEDTTVEVRVLDAAGEYASANINSIKATIAGTPINYVDSSSSLGRYSYVYNIPQEGKLQVTAEVEKLGFTTTQTSEFVINPADVQVKFTNVENLQGVAFNTYTITFETSTPHGTLLETTNKVRMLKPDGTYDDVNTVSGSNGRYSFTYLLNQEGGYKAKVTSSATGFAAKEHDSPFMNVIKDGGTALECTTNDQCSLGKICQNNTCISSTTETPWLMYIVITIVTLLIIVVTILIIKLLKKKSSTQVDPSLINI
jgi:hypothetical protein